MKKALVGLSLLVFLSSMGCISYTHHVYHNSPPTRPRRATPPPPPQPAPVERIQENMSYSQEINRGASGGTARADTTQEPAKKVVNDHMAGPRGVVEAFAERVELDREPNSDGPRLPGLPAECREAIKSMREGQDNSYMAALGAVIVRHATECRRRLAHGVPLDTENELAKVFLEGMPYQERQGFTEEELLNTTLVRWIMVHREIFGESALLDRELRDFREAEESRQ